MATRLKHAPETKWPWWKKTLIGILILAAVILLVLGGYLLYLESHYYRIEGETNLEVTTHENLPQAKKQNPYTMISWNTGFGAYNPEFSFFMDSGEGKNGETYQGKRSTAESSDAVASNLTGMEGILKNLNPDIMLLQEVDEKATRSYHINMKASFEDTFPSDDSVFAQNFHSVYLAYPFNDPHGSVIAGLLTLSGLQIDSASRYAYPVDETFITKFFDLDRCFDACEIPVEGSTKKLIVVNSHMSAYDKEGKVRDAQMDVLCNFLEEQYNLGNYIIVGGDFNQILTGEADHFDSQMKVPDWVYPFDESRLPDGFSVVKAQNADSVPTIRGTEAPYEKGVSYTTIVDGFIISDNITAGAENIDTDFQFSDHNPVKLTFTLEG